MDRSEMLSCLSQILCAATSIQECPANNEEKCLKYGECRLQEKTNEQLEYILSPSDRSVYLEACAGSGKTEVLGAKAAYEMRKWQQRDSGIAVLTFTNEATKTIRDRIALFYPNMLHSTHYVGTFSSFVHGYIAQKFGYAFFRKKCSKRDRSFSIIDVSKKSYHTDWLDNYKLNFPAPLNRTKFCANQLYFRFSDKKWFLQLTESSMALRDYYNQPEMHATIEAMRQKYKRNDIYGYEFLLQKVKDCKKKFWRAGFATFEDMNLIAWQCLRQRDIRSRLSRRFPLILVDECQDLSYTELSILAHLRRAGSNIHFIGDLNQSIYSFKDAKPEFLKRLIDVSEFQVLHLSENFRSTQKIVDVACAVQGIKQKIIGNESSINDGNDAYYFEYQNVQEAIPLFQNLINKLSIPVQHTVALVRNSSLKDKLNSNASADTDKHLLISAMQLWSIDNQQNKIKALQLLGLQIQKWLKTQGRNDNYYYSASFCKSVFLWRLILRDILNDMTSHDILCTFEGKNYSEWYGTARSVVFDIINNHLRHARESNSVEISGASLRAPSGTASKPIQTLIECERTTLKAETIHSVKGGSYDAVLLISAPNATGQTGYWERWIDDKGETTRFAYVACTRPRYLLCWAVPVLNSTQRTKLESTGLVRLGEQNSV